MTADHLVIFDGDDTLWSTEPLYDAARGGVACLIERLGLDPLAWEARERVLDVQRVATLGFSVERFPGSCLIAADEAAARDRRKLPATARNEIVDIAKTVFTSPAPLIDGAAEVLEQMAHEFSLALLTAGDARVQLRRVANSGLLPYFGDDVRIVPAKSEETFRLVIGQRPASACLSVGNSLPSDVNPALRVGMGAVWLTDAEPWEHERREIEPDDSDVLYVAESLTDVPRFAEKWRAVQSAPR